MRYFSKIRPEQPLWMASTGKRLKFDQVAHGVGALQTDDPVILSDIDAAITNQSGGVTEIDAAQYQDLLKKKEIWKASPPPLLWREEITPPSLGDTALSPLTKAVVADKLPEPILASAIPEPRSKARIGRR